MMAVTSSGFVPLVEEADDDQSVPAGGAGASASLTTCAVQSWDPNDKFGPSGVGDARYLHRGVPLSYNVVFENQATATAPAQEVVITDQLDASALDVGTFALGPINFGATQVDVPPGL